MPDRKLSVKQIGQSSFWHIIRFCHHLSRLCAVIGFVIPLGNILGYYNTRLTRIFYWFGTETPIQIHIALAIMSTAMAVFLVTLVIEHVYYRRVCNGT
jgi:hypothetical protein